MSILYAKPFRARASRIERSPPPGVGTKYGNSVTSTILRAAEIPPDNL
jgi:hypothetical protein